MLMRAMWLGTVGLMACLAADMPYAAAQEHPAAKIAVLDDMSGPYSGVNGPGDVLSARMAIEDFGGKVLDQPIELVSADDQNQPDTGLTIARHWIDLDHVTLITGLGNSAVALGVQNLARERKIVDIVVGGVTYDLTGKDCSPTGFHWIHNSRSLATGVAHAVASEALKTWFFVTVDYTFGAGLEHKASAAIIREGGTVVGDTKFPFKTTDFSSYMLQAQTSKAKVVALATAGSDLINALKAAKEFGLQASGQTLAAFAFYPTDVDAVGIETAQGLLTSSAFFSGLDDSTKAFNQRFASRHYVYGYFAPAISNAYDRRVSAATAYLDPTTRQRSDLTIQSECEVQSLVLEGQHCRGVRASVAGQPVTFTGREVIVSAGALHSPVVLMRAGIGPADSAFLRRSVRPAISVRTR